MFTERLLAMIRHFISDKMQTNQKVPFIKSSSRLSVKNTKNTTKKYRNVYHEYIFIEHSVLKVHFLLVLSIVV